MGLKTSAPGRFQIPTAPASGTAVAQAAAADTYGSYVQMIASTSADLLITGIYGGLAGVTNLPNYLAVAIGVGAAASEVLQSMELVPVGPTASGNTTTWSGYKACIPPIPVPSGSRIALKTASSVTAAAAWKLILECVATANVVSDGISEDADVKKINGVATTSVTTVSANIGTTAPINFTGIGVSALVKGDAINWNSVAVTGMPMPTYTQPTGFLAANFTTGILAFISGTTQTLDALQTALNSAHGSGSWATATGFATINPDNAGIAAIKTKTDFLPSATAGAAGGLMIAGSNAATTFASLTCTGTFTISDGVVVNRSTGNSSAVVLTGTGTGHGLASTGGATGDGIRATGGATGGTGLYVLGTGVNYGLLCTGPIGGGWFGAGTNGFSGLTLAGLGSGSGLYAAGGIIGGHGIHAIGSDGNGLQCSSTSGDAFNATSAIGVDMRADITGTLSGSVGSVTADVGITQTGADKVWGTTTRTITGGTIGTYTGNTPQTGDSFARIGVTGSGLTSLAPSATALSTSTWPGSLATNLGTLASHDPGETLAGRTNITAGVITTTTNLTNLPAAPTDWLTAAALSAAAVAEIQSGLATSANQTTINNNVLAVPAAITLDHGAGSYLALDAAGVRSAVGLAAANLDTQLADVPTVAEMNARTLAAASYATPTNITAASGVTLDLTQAVPTSNTPQTLGDCLNAARAQGFGKWAIVGTTLTLYAADGTTVVRTFTLDSATAPTSRV